MTKRNEQFENLSAYLDGELSPQQRASVEIQVDEDSSIAQNLESLEKTKQLVSSLPKASLPTEFSQNIVKILKAKQLNDAQNNNPDDQDAKSQPSKAAKIKATFSVKRYLATAAALILTGVLSVHYAYNFISIGKNNLKPTVSTERDSLAIKDNTIFKRADKIAARQRNLKSQEFLADRADMADEVESFATLVENSQGNVCNIDIYTDDIEASKKQIAKILKANDVTIVPDSQLAVFSNQAKVLDPKSQKLIQQKDRLGYYDSPPSNKNNEFAVVVNATLVQQERIASEINSQVINNIGKSVSQIAPPAYEVAVQSPGTVEKIIDKINNIPGSEYIRSKSKMGGCAKQSLPTNSKEATGEQIAAHEDSEDEGDYDCDDNDKSFKGAEPKYNKKPAVNPTPKVALGGKKQAKDCKSADKSNCKITNEKLAINKERKNKAARSNDIEKIAKPTGREICKNDELKPNDPIANKPDTGIQLNSRLTLDDKKSKCKAVKKKKNKIKLAKKLSPKPMLIRIRFRKPINKLSFKQQRAAKLAESNRKLLEANSLMLKKELRRIKNENKIINTSPGKNAK